MPDTRTYADRRETRDNLVEVAARLLREQGAAAVTTRAVAEAAGVQAPTIYRLFGDKDGLLDAVAEHVLADYVADKAVAADSGDPIAVLRGAWHTHIGFGLANAALFAFIADPSRGSRSPAAAAGMEVLRNRMRRVAATGRLRVTERRAVDLFHAAGTGTVFTLLSMAPRGPGPRPGGRHVRRGDADDPDRRPRAPRRRARPRPPSRSVPSCPTSRPSATPNARCYPSGWTEPAAADDPGPLLSGPSSPGRRA